MRSDVIGDFHEPYGAVLAVAVGIRKSILVLRVEPPEPLNALSGVHFSGVDVALVIDRNVMQGDELAGLTADAAKSPQHLLGAVIDDADFAVGAIVHVDELLLLVGREHELVDRARGQRVLLVEMLGYERAVFAENLDTIIGAVADI